MNERTFRRKASETLAEGYREVTLVITTDDQGTPLTIKTENEGSVEGLRETPQVQG